MTSKYLYLTKLDWADNWINGKSIPISLASRYKSNVREGILTPDENRIHESNFDLNKLAPFINFTDGASCKNINLEGVIINGDELPTVQDAKFYIEDGLILSFCNIESEEIARKLKKQVCVRIKDIDKLKKSFDNQIGFMSIMKSCEYTSKHQRNHFLKSNQDEWQNEFRLFWKSLREENLTVPIGIAEIVKIYK